MFNRKLKKELTERFAKMQDEVKIVLFVGGPYPKVEKESERVLREISTFSPKLSFEKYSLRSKKAKKEGIKKAPAIVLERKERKNVRFFGFPSGYQFPVFVMDLLEVSGDKQEISRNLLQEAKKIKKKTKIEVFAMPLDKWSYIAVKLAHDIAIANPRVTADMIDFFLFHELAKKYGIKGVPATVINRKKKLFGVRPLVELLSFLK